MILDVARGMSVFSFLKLYLLLNLGFRTLQLVISWHWLFSNKNQVKQRDRLSVTNLKKKMILWMKKKQCVSVLKWFWMPQARNNCTWKQNSLTRFSNRLFHQYTILSYSALFCWPWAPFWLHQWTHLWVLQVSSVGLLFLNQEHKSSHSVVSGERIVHEV